MEEDARKCLLLKVWDYLFNKLLLEGSGYSGILNPLHPVDNEDETFYPGFASKQEKGGETRAQMIASKNQNTYSNQKN